MYKIFLKTLLICAMYHTIFSMEPMPEMGKSAGNSAAVQKDLSVFSRDNELVKFADECPFGMDISLVAGVDLFGDVATEKLPLKIQMVAIKVEGRVSPSHQKKLVDLLRQLNPLRVLTKTPETVLPLVVQCENLELLDLVKKKSSASKSITFDQNVAVADFSGSLLIHLPKKAYSSDALTKEWVLKIAKKFVDNGWQPSNKIASTKEKLKSLSVWEDGLCCLDEIVYSDCVAQK